MTQIDITIRKNTGKNRKSFTMDFGLGSKTFIPPFIGIAHTKKGLGFEHHNGSPEAKLGEEFPRSNKGYRTYTYINDADFMWLNVPKGLTIDLCGTIITAKKDSRLCFENGCEPFED